jgi:ribosomal protein S18 acetylase RimI-like enzyme
MSKRISIRQAKESDLPSIKILLGELVEMMTDMQGIDLEQSTKNAEILLKDPRSHILVARDRDTVVGFINFTTRKSIIHSGSSGLVDELVVSKNCRGSGIGKRLIQATADTCRKLGCCEVEVSTEKSNTKARRFYTAMGFEEDAVLLELDL